MFNAWTDPGRVAAWYGPAHFETPAEKVRIDLRVGGRYELTMVHRDTGNEIRDRATTSSSWRSRRCSSCARIRCPSMGMHEPTVTRVELHDHGDKTRMTLTDGPYPGGGRHAEAGWNAAFDKLAGHVARS